MNNADYWRGRFSILEDSAQSKADRNIAALEDMFTDAERSVQKELEQWYGRFATTNGISLTDARKMLTTGELEEFKWSVDQYIQAATNGNTSAEWLKKLENASTRFHVSRLEAIQVGIQQQIELLYGNHLDDLDGVLKQVVGNGYTYTAYEVQKGLGLGWDISALNQKKLETLLSKPWSTDERTFRDRCWLNKAELVSTVNRELTQGLLRGDGLNKISATIQQKFGVARYKAQRLVRTETTYFNSVATLESYRELGIEKVEILETLDNRTCEICGPLDGTVIPLSQYEPGVTVPPFHPNCRGTTCPYYADMDGERAARNADGEVYNVPADMKYSDWKKAFVGGGDKAGLTIATAEGIVEASKKLDGLKQTIMDQNKGFLSDEQQTELEAIVDGMTEEQREMYSRLGVNFQNSDYHMKGAGWYTPSKHKIEMDMDCHPWDKAVGTGKTGAWKTKFHEEGHQLDHILALQKCDLAETSSGSLSGLVCSKVSDPRSVSGAKMLKSIETDVLNAVNKGISARNVIRVEMGLDASLKPITSLSRISGDAKDSLVWYLDRIAKTSKARAEIDMFTDAVGLVTENRICLYGQGYWGHKPSYNKERGKAGATSETFATFHAWYMGGTTSGDSALLQELMPETWKTYTDIFDQILKYATNNPLTYP